MTTVTNPLNQSTTYGYNADGQRATVTDPLNHTTTTTYDAQGRVLTVTAPNGGVTTNTYDAAGNLLTLTDPVNNTTTYTYNAINELVNTTNPMGHLSTNTYNAAGELTSTTDADGRTIDYSYDAIGEKIGETWVSGNYTATYLYDAAGELTKASDPNSVYSYTYDAAGRLTSVSNAGTPGVPSVTLSYSYDGFSNLTGVTDNLGGSISYSYDNAKNLTGLSLSLNGVQTAAVTMAYDTANRLTGETRTAPSVNGDTITSSYNYDNADELTGIIYTDSTKYLTLANYTYSYNAASQLTGYQDNNNSSLTYGYDANGELTSASGTLNGSNYAVSYSYDANGNRTMTGYTTGKGNELTSDGTYNYTYDNDGNTLTQTNIATGSVTYYTWDYRNRLTEVKQETSTGTVINDEKFTYDVNNNRIAVSLNGTPQLYTVYDGANPYLDFNGSGQLLQRYLSNPGTLNEFYGQVSSSGTVQWFLIDNINSIRQVVNTSGSLLDSITYDPFGSILNQTNQVNAPRLLYAGGGYDPLSGTYQDGAREDDPEDGRWLNQDPLGLKPDTNPYRYVANDPLNAIDPTGLEDKKSHKEEVMIKASDTQTWTGGGSGEEGFVTGTIEVTRLHMISIKVTYDSWNLKEKQVSGGGENELTKVQNGMGKFDVTAKEPRWLLLPRVNQNIGTATHKDKDGKEVKSTTVTWSWSFLKPPPDSLSGSMVISMFLLNNQGEFVKQPESLRITWNAEIKNSRQPYEVIGGKASITVSEK